MQGEVVQCPIFGYIKPQGLKHDRDLQKDPTAEPVYREWFRKLDEGASYSEIADWLNGQHMPWPRSASTGVRQLRYGISVAR